MAETLAETFDGAFEESGTLIAATAVDGSGKAIATGHNAVPAHARFEIGSVTKTMTGVLLAMLAMDGLTELDAPIGRWLEAGPHGDITLRQLATHTSGLPNLAPQCRPGRARAANPYASFSERIAEETIPRMETGPPGHYLYSNLGYQLLGLALARAAGLPYPALLRERLLGPLSMTCAGVPPCPSGARIPGHADGREVPHWDQPLPGAGGVEACIDDVAAYLAAWLCPPTGRLGRAMARAVQSEVQLGGLGGGSARGFGWVVRSDGIVHHNGSTGGFSAAIAAAPGSGRGVAVLASSGGQAAALEQAAVLAVTGADPRSARPSPADARWGDRACDLVRLLMAGEAGSVHAAMTADLRARLPLRQLIRFWVVRTYGDRPTGELAATCHRDGPATVADVTAVLGRGSLRLRFVFSPAGEVSGFSALPAVREDLAG